jgi:hypothetical protein
MTKPQKRVRRTKTEGEFVVQREELTPVAQPETVGLTNQEKYDALRSAVRPLQPRPQAEVPSGRITVVATIHYQEKGRNPDSLDFRNYRFTDTSGEERFSRRRKVGEAPEPLLKHSWIEEPGLLIVENLTEDPTPADGEEEPDNSGSAVWLLRDGTPVEEIVVGLPYIGRPPEAMSLTVRSAAGTAEIRVTALPR